MKTLNSATPLIQIQPRRLLLAEYVYVGLDVHKKTISYCVKDASGRIQSEGTIPATRMDLDRWMKILPQPRMAEMEAAIFSGCIYDRMCFLPILPNLSELHLKPMPRNMEKKLGVTAFRPVAQLVRALP